MMFSSSAVQLEFAGSNFNGVPQNSEQANLWPHGIVLAVVELAALQPCFSSAG